MKVIEFFLNEKVHLIFDTEQYRELWEFEDSFGFINKKTKQIYEVFKSNILYNTTYEVGE